MRICVFLALLMSLGCAGHKPLPRWLVLSDPRVELEPDQHTAVAIVGDCVFIEIGKIVLDPDSKGYVVTVDGRKLAHPEWDIKDADFRLRFRAKEIGEHKIEIQIPFPGGEPQTRTYVVNVIE